MAISFVFLPQPSEEPPGAKGSNTLGSSHSRGNTQSFLAESRYYLKNKLLPPHAVRSMFKYTHGSIARLDDMEQELGETMLSFRYYINQIFEAMEFTSPVELKSDLHGTIYVGNPHPDKGRIERIFRENTDLRHMSIQIMALADLVESTKEAAAFHDAYKANPQAAIARFFYLFDERSNVNRFYLNLRAKDELWTVTAVPERIYKFRFNPHSSGDLIQPPIDDFWVKWNLDR